MKYLKIVLRKILRKIKQEDFSKEYKTILSLKTKKQLKEFQQQKLKELILHAYKNVPYYTKIFKKIKIIKNNEVDLTKFKKIPILTKEIIRKNFKDLTSKNKDQKKIIYTKTSGSTGKNLTVMHDENFFCWSMATDRHFFNKIVRVNKDNNKEVQLWGSKKDLTLGFKGMIIDWLFNRKSIHSAFLTVDNIRLIQRYKPKFIFGYANSIYQICKLAKKNNLKFPKVQTIIPIGEMLTPPMRKTIEKSFRTKAYDLYGCREQGLISGEDGTSSKTCPFYNYIETIGSRKEKDIVITNLHNKVMPIIRYKVEDIGIPDKIDIDLGVLSFKDINGRKIDYFAKRNGEIINGFLFYHILIREKWIRQFKIIQEDYEKIRLLIVKEREPKKEEKDKIETSIKQVLENNCTIEWNFVSEIPRTSSGKYLYIKSKVKK